ncbi:MAG: hypothetical protein Q8906_15275 [Bacillota bacterium]|nr:hypothetical protein [Bacillota bacterium]MDP4171969.1 hypothetical protein [Bacillota bacterium]
MEFLNIDIDRLLEITLEIDTVQSHLIENFVEIDQLLEQTRDW